ncbi:hypothetical protein ACFLSE_06010 [Bacteroidota bacterium]
MRKFTLALLVILFATHLNAQEKSFNNFDFGAGMGLNYGGFGFNLSVAPIPFISLEGFLGYNFLEPNVGGAVNIHVIPKNNTKTYNLALKSMYGYNTVLITLDGDMDSKTFYGLSFGISNKLRFGSRKRSGLDLDLLIPIRSKEATDYYDELVDNDYEMTPLSPIAISIGYHFEF